MRTARFGGNVNTGSGGVCIPGHTTPWYTHPYILPWYTHPSPLVDRQWYTHPLVYLSPPPAYHSLS